MYPALAVLRAIENSDNVNAILWVGAANGIERELVERENIPFKGISAAGLHGVGLRKLPGNLIRLIRGFFQSAAIIRSFNPDVLFFTGGYIGFPVALAGLFRKKVIFIPDIEPALTLTALSKVADRITVVAEESRAYLPKRKNIVVTGYPTRPKLTESTKAQAYAEFGLNSELPTVFVFGGSKGARSINDAILEILPEITKTAQLIHVAGSGNWDEVRVKIEALPEFVRSRYRAFPYLHEKMGAAFRAADLIVSRAGASTIGEFPLFGVPAILIPYPHAWRYQRINAEYLVNTGAAVMIRDENMRAELLPAVTALLADAEKRGRMSAAMSAIARPDAARAIIDVLRDAGAKNENLNIEA